MKHLTTLFFMFTMLQSGFSQFILSGEFRPRAEYRHGYGNMPDSGATAGFFIDQRTRLNLDYSSKGFRTYISLQDVRVWGDQKQLVGNENASISVHEAWVETSIYKKVSLKLGRQEIIYDDHRIFGNVGWAQQARSHDAAILKFKTKKLKLNIGAAYNQESKANSWIQYNLSNYKSLIFVWVNHKVNDNLKISLLFLNNGLQPFELNQSVYELDSTNSPVVVGTEDVHRNIFSQTIGTHVNFKKGGFVANANFYYQTGTSNSSWGYDKKFSGSWTDTKLQAMLIGLDLNYQINKNFKLFAGFEMQSGNSQTDTTQSYKETQHAFTPFYGTNHKFNGYMDYFYVGNHNGSVGLFDIFAGIKYTLKNNIFSGTFHSFSAAANVLDVQQYNKTGEVKALSSGLGNEIDLSWARPLTEGVMMKLGFSTFMGTTTMEILRGGSKEEFAGWGYLMIVVKPTFLKSEKK